MPTSVSRPPPLAAGAAGSVPDETGKRRYVREMFSAIAPRYDLLNHLLSLNIDRIWRRRAVASLRWDRRPDGAYLDACAGTLDLSLALARSRGFRGRVVATDFALPMLKLGKAKVAGEGAWCAAADTLALPFPDCAFDGAMVAFGVRNLSDMDGGLAELRRVLRPGARLVVLEFTTPRSRALRGLFLFYFLRVLPAVGRFVSGHPTAYSYLPASVLEFPAPEALEASLRRAGFREVSHRLLTGGIVAVHWGER
jgi:demethylmenaquinone methyltransferase/2-methoxy-6-polyprenyl-1,4-benzoquinol methylase